MREYICKLRNGPMHIYGGYKKRTSGNLALMQAKSKEDLLKNNNHIESVEENQLFSIPDTEQSEPTEQEIASKKEITWGLKQLVIKEGWQIRTNHPVRVCVIDTGIDLNLKDLATPYQFESFVFGEDSVWDYHGHGTHVAGTIAALSNNQGIVGVHPGLELFVAKIFPKDGKASLMDILSAIDWASRWGCDIINASWGGGDRSDLLEQYIKDSGALFVNAAGNDGINTDKNPVYPGGYRLPNMLVVGATGPHFIPPWWSNFGEQTIDVVAPGVDILSLKPGGGYVKMSGTSMAAPHVTGMASLIWQGSIESTKAWILEKAREKGRPRFWLTSPPTVFSAKGQSSSSGSSGTSSSSGSSGSSPV